MADVKARIPSALIALLFNVEAALAAVTTDDFWPRTSQGKNMKERLAC